MKKRINILLLAGLLFSAVACDDSENNFSESTSTRIEQTLERYKFALQAGKTWVMEYFPDENLGYGGWIYIVEFQDDRMVKAWFEGSTFVEADPLYALARGVGQIFLLDHTLHIIQNIFHLSIRNVIQ